MKLPASVVQAWSDLQRNFDALAKAVAGGTDAQIALRSQGIGPLAQVGGGPGAAVAFNVAGAPLLTLTPGLWRITGSTFVFANGNEVITLGLWNDTAGAGISFSGGPVVSVNSAAAGAAGGQVVATSFDLRVATVTKIRLWAIPIIGFTITVGNAGAAATVALLNAQKLRD